MAKTLEFPLGPNVITFAPLGKGKFIGGDAYKAAGLHEVLLNGTQRAWVGYERGMNAGHRLYGRRPTWAPREFRPEHVSTGSFTIAQVFRFDSRDFAYVAERIVPLFMEGKLPTEGECKAMFAASLVRAAVKRQQDAASWAAKIRGDQERRAAERLARIDQRDAMIAMQARLQGLGALSNSEAVALDQAVQQAVAAAYDEPRRARLPDRDPDPYEGL